MDIGRFSFIRGVKKSPNKFGYKGRFYDSKKEEFEKRISRLDAELNKENADVPSGRISFERRDKSNLKSVHRKQASLSNLIVIVLVILLCFIAYYVLNLVNTSNV